MKSCHYCKGKIEINSLEISCGFAEFQFQQEANYSSKRKPHLTSGNHYQNPELVMNIEISLKQHERLKINTSTESKSSLR